MTDLKSEQGTSYCFFSWNFATSAPTARLAVSSLAFLPSCLGREQGEMHLVSPLHLCSKSINISTSSFTQGLLVLIIFTICFYASNSAPTLHHCRATQISTSCPTSELQLSQYGPSDSQLISRYRGSPHASLWAASHSTTARQRHPDVAGRLSRFPGVYMHGC